MTIHFCMQEKVIEISNKLSPFLPKGTEFFIARQIIAENISFRVTRPRKTKLGDYRPPYGNKSHRITINGDLNEYAFFVTTVHEIAHLYCWKRYGSKVKPHGKEWKREFQNLLSPFLSKAFFPSNLKEALYQYIKNPAASSCSDIRLTKVLATFNDDPALFLDDIPHGDYFQLNSRTFIKGRKLRTRYHCKEIASKKYYLISGIAHVKRIQNNRL